jgi:hypothetical protein
MDTGQAAFGVASLRMGRSYRDRGSDVFSRAASSVRGDEEDDEDALTWAALERLPTHSRVRKGIVGDGELVDVAGLGFQERTRLLERLVRVAEEDHERFLLKLRQRIDRCLVAAILLALLLLCNSLSSSTSIVHVNLPC